MPDYTLNNIVSSGDDLIEIGFEVEGYEVENIRGRKIIIQQTQASGGFGSESGSVSVSIGGYIDEEASKQLVVSFSNHQSIIVTIKGDGTHAMCKCSTESKYGLPNTLNENTFNGRMTQISAIMGGNNNWLCGIMVTPAMIANYVKHYYNDCEWSEQNVVSLIASKLIRAQVCFAKGGSGVYFNATVIDVPPTGFGDTAVSIDTQLFLAINALKSEFTVTATDGSGKSETVGGNLEPLNTGVYTYTSATLSNYDLAHTSFFDIGALYNGEQHFKNVSVASSKYDQARIRFFVRAEDRDAIQKILNDKIPDGLVGEPTAYYTEAMQQLDYNGPIPDFDPTKCTLTGNPATDTCFYQPNQSNYAKLAAAKGQNWATYSSIIENVCRELNFNTRMYCTQVVQESGWAFNSKAFREYNNPGGLTWCFAGTEATYKGVHVRKNPIKRGEGYGHYMIFDNKRDGIYAMVRLLVDKYRMGAQTVGQCYDNMGRGGYCDKRENSHYANDLKKLYSTSITRFLN